MLIDTREAEKHYGYSRQTLYKYAREGKIEAEKIGNEWRFKVNKEKIKNEGN